MTKQMKVNPKNQRVKKKAKRVVSDAVFHIQASFNNTIVTLADTQGNGLGWATAGGCGFRGSRKSTPHAAQLATERVCAIAHEHQVKIVSIVVCGPGPGREAAMRTISNSGFKVVVMSDKTRIPHNGCKPKKERRV